MSLKAPSSSRGMGGNKLQCEPIFDLIAANIEKVHRELITLAINLHVHNNCQYIGLVNVYYIMYSRICIIATVYNFMYYITLQP